MVVFGQKGYQRVLILVGFTEIDIRTYRIYTVVVGHMVVEIGHLRVIFLLQRRRKRSPFQPPHLGGRLHEQAGGGKEKRPLYLQAGHGGGIAVGNGYRPVARQTVHGRIDASARENVVEHLVGAEALFVVAGQTKLLPIILNHEFLLFLQTHALFEQRVEILQKILVGGSGMAQCRPEGREQKQ